MANDTSKKLQGDLFNRNLGELLARGKSKSSKSTSKKQIKLPKNPQDFPKFMKQFRDEDDFLDWVEKNNESNQFQQWMNYIGGPQVFENLVAKYTGIEPETIGENLAGEGQGEGEGEGIAGEELTKGEDGKPLTNKGKRIRIPKHPEDFDKFMNQFKNEDEFMQWLDKNENDPRLQNWIISMGGPEDIKKLVDNYVIAKTPAEGLKGGKYKRPPLTGISQETFNALTNRVMKLSPKEKEAVKKGAVDLAIAEFHQKSPEALEEQDIREGNPYYRAYERNEEENEEAANRAEENEMKFIRPHGYQPFQVPEYTKQQYERLKEGLERVGPESYLAKLAEGNEDVFNQIEAPSRKKFNELQGNIASRFSAMGAGGRRSSGFKNEMTQAAQDYQAQLQAQRQGLRREAMEDLMGYTSNLLEKRPRTRGLVQKPPKEVEQDWNWGEAALKYLPGAAANIISAIT